jgi:hypothetical protein
MARISAYDIDIQVTGYDKVIGTDASGSVTKNFRLSSIAEFFDKTGSIGILGQNNFKFQTSNVIGRQSGTISFNTFGGNGTSFNSITTIKISKYASSNNLILDYLQTLVDQYIILAQLDDLNNFGIYRLLSLTQDVDEPDFYDAVFLLQESHGALQSEKYYGIAVYPSPSNEIADKHYFHNQAIAASTWIVNHNLRKYPSVTVTLSTGQVGYADVMYIDENNLTITFSGANSGKAYMN